MTARSGQRRTVRLVHFSDYHAHAVPFYYDGEKDTAGFARLVAYLRTVRPSAVVTNGGDMLNVGSPPWSDRYQGAEAPWLNGLVDVMALGNHDSDYGGDVFRRTRTALDHPVLCANLVDGRGDPVLTSRDGRGYLVLERDGIRLGLVAAAGPDVPELIPDQAWPVHGARFVDRIDVVDEIVTRMRRQDRVDVVVLVGHALFEDDVALVRAVPGIDLVLGTHSHRLEDLTLIPGTDTFTISPYQYATHAADLRLDFVGGALVAVEGGLVRMGADRPEAPDVAAWVADRHSELVTDEHYAHLFEEIGHAPRSVSTQGQDHGESELGNLTADAVRGACGSDVALVGGSAIREPIPPGSIRVGDVLAALPYENQMMVYEISGARLRDLLDASVRHRGTNFHAQVSGVRFTVADGCAQSVRVHDGDGWQSLDPGRTYDIAVNDFLAARMPGFRQLLANETSRPSGIWLRDAVIDWIRVTGRVEGHVDGRICRIDGRAPVV